MSAKCDSWRIKSSEALLPFVVDQQTDGQNICRIDAHIQEECAHKKWELYLI